MTQYSIMLMCSLLLFVMTTFRNSIQDGTKFYWMSEIPSDDVLECLYKLRICESAQLKNRIRNVRHGDSSEDIDAQSSEIEDKGEKEYRSETTITELRRQAWEN